MCDVRSYEAVTTCNKCIKCRNDTPSWTVTVCTDDGPQWAPKKKKTFFIKIKLAFIFILRTLPCSHHLKTFPSNVKPNTVSFPLKSRQF